MDKYPPPDAAFYRQILSYSARTREEHIESLLAYLTRAGATPAPSWLYCPSGAGVSVYGWIFPKHSGAAPNLLGIEATDADAASVAGIFEAAMRLHKLRVLQAVCDD